MTWHLSEPSPSLFACSDSLHGFETVRQGVSLRGGEEGRNFSFSVAIDHQEVCTNRQRASEWFGFDPGKIVVPEQIHACGVAVVDASSAGCGSLSPETAIPRADALVTNSPGILLCITIADCLPVFFYDQVNHAVGLAHSGWRGTAGGIAPRTLSIMTEQFGTRPDDVLVAIGPGISPDTYEVDWRVFQQFQQADIETSGVFAETRNGHFALDLTLCVYHQLWRAGVSEKNIDVSPWRTDRDTDLFFSHRLVSNCPRMGAFLGML